MSSTLWKSDRLVFRGLEKEDDDFLYVVHNDAESWLNSAPILPVPATFASGGATFREFMSKSLMSAMICLPGPPPPGHPSAAPPSSPSNDPDQKSAPPAPPRPIAVRTTTPIGYVCLGMQGDEKWQQHRHAEIGITIQAEYQGQGYGSEAIRWALQWGFQRANLHRIAIGHFAWNEGAGRLYQRLGFIPEGRMRDFLWHDGEYHDLVMLAMLEHEWRATNPKKPAAKQIAQEVAL